MADDELYFKVCAYTETYDIVVNFKQNQKNKLFYMGNTTAVTYMYVN